MRFLCLLITLATSITAASTDPGTAGLIVPPDGTIGQSLEGFTNVRLSKPAPAGGLDVTITSQDPKRLLLSFLPNTAGSKSITLKVKAQYIATPDFYLQGFADSGSVTYTASAPGYTSATGTITLAPSAILIAGPFEASILQTTAGASAKVRIYSALIDSSGAFVQDQPVAGGLTVNIHVSTSDGKVGSVTPSPIVLTGGRNATIASFQPAGTGKTKLSVDAPSGFTAGAQLASLTANVDLPGIGITGEIHLGKDLQVQGYVFLGEPAPAKGVVVNLTSDDPKRLVLSAGENQPGSGSINLSVPAGETRVPYYIQGLGDSGTVNYSATAPGFRTRVAPVTLAPSGVMVAYSLYGPPDEAEVLRKVAVTDPRPFTTSLSDRKPTHVTVWTAYLDPSSRRGADFTVQELRPGVSATVDLKSSNPDVAKVAPTITVASCSHSASTEFVPLKTGQTVISVSTPNGFTTPTNATEVTATVKE